MEDAGLVKVVRTKRVRALEAKYYGRTARVFRFHTVAEAADIHQVSLRQRIIPDHLLGRVNSVYRFFGWGTISLGTLLGGLMVTLGEPVLGREWALRAPFLVAGSASLALLAYAVPNINTARIEAAEQAAEQAADAPNARTEQEMSMRARRAVRPAAP